MEGQAGAVGVEGERIGKKVTGEERRFISTVGEILLRFAQLLPSIILGGKRPGIVSGVLLRARLSKSYAGCTFYVEPSISATTPCDSHRIVRPVYFRMRKERLVAA